MPKGSPAKPSLTAPPPTSSPGDQGKGGGADARDVCALDTLPGSPAVPNGQDTSPGGHDKSEDEPVLSPKQLFPDDAGKEEDVDMKKGNEKEGENHGVETTKRGREEDEGDLYVEALPPPVLTEKAIYSRIHRIFKKRKDGSYILDDKWMQAWNDIEGGGRASMFSIFEKVGYNRDRFAKLFFESPKCFRLWGWYSSFNDLQ